VFIVAAWGLLQVADLAFQSLGVPGEALRFVWIGAAVCFPFALIFGWRYDVTAEGVKRTPSAEPGEGLDLSLKSVDYLVLSCLVVIVVLIGFGVGTRILMEEGDDSTDAPSIAVLPFSNLSGNPDNDYFSDGMTEETISLLADIPELKVAPRSSTRKYRGNEYSIPAVAQRLSVRFVLEGSVHMQDDRVRVTTSLIDAKTESALWTDTYDRSIDDVIGIQRDIAGNVADALEVVLSSHSRERLNKPYTADPDAYLSYLQGRNALRKPKSDANFRAAVDQFDKAIEADPDFAEAYAGLCEARLGQYEMSATTSFFEKAESTCLRALTRDNEAIYTYLALANLHFFSGQYERAEQEFRHILALNPTLVDARLGLARTYAALDRVELAETAFRRAIHEDPGYWDCYQLYGNFLISRGRYGEAIANYQDAISRSKDNVNAYNNLGVAYYLTGDFDHAAHAYQESLQLLPGRAAYANTGTMYFFAGNFDTAAQMYREALKIAPDDARLWSYLGDALQSGAGTEEEAKEAYGKAQSLTGFMIGVNPSDADALQINAYTSAQLGDMQQAERTLAKAMKLDPDDMYVYYYGALIYELQGRTEETYAALQRALELGYLPALVQADPGFKRLSGEERFATLISGEHD
jgi:TolB-like protein/tetratricopeptide (TPR) repeat protein